MLEIENDIAVLLADFYKIDHVRQYPEGITRVYSNWTPRKSRVEGINKVVVFGTQYFILEYLVNRFNETFFHRRKDEILETYRNVIQKTLGIQNPKTDHIAALHDLGYLPLAIWAIPEGYSVNINVPSIVIYNTKPEFFWLTNFIETMMSMVLWKPSTSATTALAFRKIFVKRAIEAGEKDLTFVNYQGHDFSMRGMSGLEDAILSGMGHLLSFNGTDTIPAILAAEEYYAADISNTGTSVPATEHSVMCAGEKDGEFETFRRLIEDVYPDGIVSIVSDTWDLWTVLTDYIPRLKDKILARNGKIVIRPDSGDPVEIVVGKDAVNVYSPRFTNPKPEDLGVIKLLGDALGWDTNRKDGRLPLIINGGAIYGDGITLERADQILDKLINHWAVSPFNMVFGIGSYTYEYVTRDTFGFAMKATAIERGGKVIPIFKDPKTDSGLKKSRKGILAVYKAEDWSEKNNNWVCKEDATLEDLENCDLECVFLDGNVLGLNKFEVIKNRVRTQSYA